jgi:hypothetical protein
MGCIGRLYPKDMKGALDAGARGAGRNAGQQRRPGPGSGVAQMAPTHQHDRRRHGQRPAYRLPRQPTVVVCIDGSEPGYIEAAVDGRPRAVVRQGAEEGTNLLADCVVPSSPTPTTSRSSPAGRRRCTASAATTSSIPTAGRK